MSADGSLLGVKFNGSYYYYHYDAQGNVEAVTDSNDIVYRQYVYDPYGNIISVKDGNGTAVNISNGTGFNNAYTYRRYRFDSETGLYFLQSRYYAAGIGRFLTKDAHGYVNYKYPQSLNLYAYCNDNPVSYVDPNGTDVGWAQSGNRQPYGLDHYTLSDYLMMGLALLGPVAKLAGIRIGVSEGAGSAGKGFNSFNALKKELGSAGEGNAWHHIVEQSQIQKSGFSSQQINNTSNVIAVDSATHAKISGYYNSIDAGLSDTLRVRDWLAGQSFETQYQFGKDVLKRFGVTK